MTEPPISTMAAMLAVAGIDLSDDNECIMTLLYSAFSPREIESGLSAAMAEAVKLRNETGTPS